MFCTVLLFVVCWSLRGLPTKIRIFYLSHVLACMMVWTKLELAVISIWTMPTNLNRKPPSFSNTYLCSIQFTFGDVFLSVDKIFWSLRVLLRPRAKLMRTCSPCFQKRCQALCCITSKLIRIWSQVRISVLIKPAFVVGIYLAWSIMSKLPSTRFFFSDY